MTCGCSCGSIRKTPVVTPPVEDTVLSIMGGNVVAGWDANSLIVSPVATWQDEGPGSFALTATDSLQPSWTAAGGPNGQPTVLFDGTDLLVNPTLNLPAPATTPTFYWGVIRRFALAPAGRMVCAGALGGIEIVQSFTVDQRNTFAANQNAMGASGTWGRLEVLYNNVSDYFKFIAISAATAIAGNNDPIAGWAMGGTPTATNLTTFETGIFYIFNAEPTISQKAALDILVTNRFGAGLV